MEKPIDSHPILQIANTVDVSICRPDEIMILSILDSVCIDRGSFFEPGAITTFAFPKTEAQIHQFNFDGKSYAKRVYFKNNVG